MTDFFYRREGIIIQTELTPRQLELIEELRQIEENDPTYKTYTNGSGPVREYSIDYRVPYGHYLGEPRQAIINRITRSRDFINGRLGILQMHFPKAVELMTRMRDKFDEIVTGAEAT